MFKISYGGKHEKESYLSLGLVSSISPHFIYVTIWNLESIAK